MNNKPKIHPTDRSEHLRKMLTRLRKESLERISKLRNHQAQESQADPGDEVDSAQTTEEIETHAGLIAREEEKLNYLDEAVVRLEQGKYGICTACKGPIPAPRLRAVPFALFCIDCQEKRNRARRSWGEGATIPPYDHQWTMPEEMEEAVDRESRSTDPEEQLTIHEREPLKSAESGVVVKGPPSAKRLTSRRKK